ncbi:MAG: ABC transporter substrate-binding protein, partial [Rhodospirillales bacterium]|nr:ABC transporter substrate-binding protein [Rhodospirillales bacterium]
MRSPSQLPRLCFGAALTLIAAAGATEPAMAALEVYEGPPLPASIQLKDPPMLQAEVAAGRLPPIEQRMPKLPCVIPLGGERTAGQPGGQLRTLISKAKDTRLLVVYGYARLIGFDENLNLVPDILARVEVEDGRIFTLRLREGHRWSDGHPFTSEDFRYYWEDVANNENLSPTGPPSEMLVEGEAPAVEYLDEVTVRYAWSRPNPTFLTALAGARPLFIYQPAHYLKQFHARYVDEAALNAMAEETGARNWAAMHNRKDNQYHFDNPDLPTLQPWINTTRPPSERILAVRNPYYHRIDPAGYQLPYIDNVLMQIAGTSLIPAKTGAGDSDLQARGLNFSDYTFLKAGEKRSGYQVNLWRTVRGSEVALYPNLNANDPAWRALFRDVRFRRALSLGIDRHELNQVIYFGLGLEGNQSILPGSSLYKAGYRGSYAEYAPQEANRLLDELGLTERSGDGLRLLPDGRPMEIIVETAGENTEEVDLLELIHDTWLKLGIKLYSKPSQREVLRNRIFSGDTLVSMWFGYEN